MRGIVGYGAYLPYWRLQRSEITRALGAGGGRGSRSVASYDEDTTSMGVEAARVALRSAPGAPVGGVFFATTEPAYLDKTNANAIHAALGFDASVGAYDVMGSVRSSVAAMTAGLGGDHLVVLSDIRTGLPGGADEANGGDAAAAFVLGEGDPVAVPIGGASATAEFLDRWRAPGEGASRVWEERFGEYAYAPVVEQAVTDALKTAGLAPTELDHVIVSGLHTRAAKAAARTIGARPEAYADDLGNEIGNAGTAQWGVVLCDVLDRAGPDQIIALVLLADGCDVLLLRTTDAVAARRSAPSVREQLATTHDGLPYAQFLTWRGNLRREPPRRPDPDRPASPPALRTEAWKFAFAASRCTLCGTRHLPPDRVCVSCRAVDKMTAESLADVPATVATYTIDRLAFSLSPPVVAAVIDFDGGGRFQCEMTDVDPAAVRIGDRVEMTFRRLYSQDGIHNYFWKARPIRSATKG